MSFLSLPEAIRALILSRLPFESIFACRRVCRAWRQSVAALDKCPPCRVQMLQRIANLHFLPSLRELTVDCDCPPQARKEETLDLQFGAIHKLEQLRDLRIVARRLPTRVFDALSPLTSLRSLTIDCTPIQSDVGRLWDRYPAVLTRLTSLRVEGNVFLGTQLELFLCEQKGWSSPPFWSNKTLLLTAERLKELRTALLAKYRKVRGEFARSERTFNADLELLRRYLGDLFQNNIITAADFDTLSENLHRLIALGGAFAQSLEAEALPAFSAILMHRDYWALLHTNVRTVDAKLQLCNKLQPLRPPPIASQAAFQSFRLSDYMAMQAHHLLKCSFEFAGRRLHGNAAGEESHRASAQGEPLRMKDLTGMHCKYSNRQPLPAPVRILDTRVGAPAIYMPGTPISGGGVQTWNTRVGGVAADALAVSLVSAIIPPLGSPGGYVTIWPDPVGTLVAVTPTAGGYATVWPAGAAQPGTSSINFDPTVNVRNIGLNVAVGADGAISIYAAASVTIIFDATGYYA